MDASNPAHQALPKTPTSAPNQSFDWSNEQQMALAFERFVRMNPHLLHQQSKLKDEAEAKSLLKAYYDAKRAAEPKKPNVDSLLSATGSDFIQAVCAGLEMKVLFDSGANVCVISRDFVRRATASGSTLHLKPLQAPVTALAFSGTPVVIRDGVKFDLSIPTNAGPIVMTNLRCWVQELKLAAIPL
ncbi:unnamed protein product [Aphanomyces euteiches]